MSFKSPSPDRLPLSHPCDEEKIEQKTIKGIQAVESSRTEGLEQLGQSWPTEVLACLMV